MYGHVTPPNGKFEIILWALSHEYYRVRAKAGVRLQASKDALRRFVGIN